MHRNISLAALAVALSCLAPCPSFAWDTYNTVLRSHQNVHPGVNDCWGYTAPDGTELAIYGYDLGTAFVNATDPDNPVEIFDLAGPSSVWRDIKTYLNYAYIVTEGSGAGTGMQIVDLSDPLNPVYVTTYTAAGMTTAHNIWIDEPEGVAYCCGAAPGGGMHILSLADPENPVELDFFSQYYIHDLYVGNGRAYAGNIYSGALRIIDVTNPSQPVTIASHFYPDGFTHNGWPTADESHCITTDEVGGGHLKIWDISNFSNISLAGEWEPDPNGIIHNALLRDDMAYISYYTRGARIVDVTNPTAPVEVGYFDTSTRPSGFNGDWGIYCFRDDNIVYASDRQNGLFIFEFVGDFAADISGVVRDAGTMAVLDSATVTLLEDGLTLSTGGAGTYAGAVSGGSYTVITTRFGYVPDTTVVAMPGHSQVTHDVLLSASPNGAARLHLTYRGAPAEGVLMDIPGTPVHGLVSDAAGEILVPGLPVGQTWGLRVARFGLAVTEIPAAVTEGTVTDVFAELASGFQDDFEVDQGWTVGDPADDATDGFWERRIPLGSYFLGIVGPEEDATQAGTGYAYITERHVMGAYVGTSDVDTGRTSVLSPVFDATGLGSLMLNYQRWFSNRAPTPASDPFRAEISNDGGATWTNLETVNTGTDSWAAVSISLDGVITLTDSMRLRFSAEDPGSDTYVEAGLDDVEILSTATSAGIPSAATDSESLLRAPVPSPFRSSVDFSFELPASDAVELVVHDVSGRRVARLLSAERLASGVHRVRWDGRDDQGRQAVPGVYFVRLETREGVESEKVVRVR
ncbi:MAG: choice-of-anchor B family protein [Gemmatimonadota bacterium]|jgi:choice-of-anchor B domain-containing protein|nr:choice-of-anchor B family protein [Gemmatimonadota bacterium]MDP6802221.1 choice-of-anchor B family protein [Gemmatimonadota bacterium]MDP7032142.1 choice-of-anchor B family protein [Gemmatimonadota bacterium]